MMGPDLRGGLFHEEVPPIRAPIASIHIADAAEKRDTPRNHRHGRNSHGNIKNWFCIETGHCRAAHMLDIQHEMPELLL